MDLALTAKKSKLPMIIFVPVHKTQIEPKKVINIPAKFISVPQRPKKLQEM